MALTKEERRDAADELMEVAFHVHHAAIDIKTETGPLISAVFSLKNQRDRILEIVQQLSEDAGD